MAECGKEGGNIDGGWDWKAGVGPDGLAIIAVVIYDSK
jgi:hypothetical protein